MERRGIEKINYRIEGSGQPVVLLHGYLESLDIWDGFAESLALDHQVIRIDLPGHGKSETLAGIHTMDLLAEVVIHILQQENIKKPVLAGHSLGGYVTLAFVEKYAWYLSGFCLFHSHPLADTDEVRENREREISLIWEGKKHLIYQVNVPKAFALENQEKFRKEISRAIEIAKNTPDEGIIAMLKGMMQRPDRRNILENPPLPGLWILGEKDRYIPYERMKSVIKPGKGLQVVSLKNSGHMGFIEEKKPSLDVMTGFLNTL